MPYPTKYLSGLQPSFGIAAVLEFSGLTREVLGSDGQVEALHARRATLIRDEDGRSYLTELVNTDFELPGYPRPAGDRLRR